MYREGLSGNILIIGFISVGFLLIKGMDIINDSLIDIKNLIKFYGDKK